MLNEVANTLMVIFTESGAGGDIEYRLSSADTIDFGDRHTLMSGGLNNPSSTKQVFENELVVIASDGDATVSGVLFAPDAP